MRNWITIAWLQYIVLLSLSGVVVAGIKQYEYNRHDFPRDFIFGAATSAYQVEGAALEDGRTPSIFDTIAHSGQIRSDGDVACDEYHRYKEDVQLMLETGLDAYRFSISWSRLIPDGRGSVNPKGLEYYNKLINELVSHGIQPHVTLMHSDSPQVLEDEYEGFLSPRIIEDFTAYVDVCFREFGDRVQYWTTFNEANVFALGGYDVGNSPPARCSFPFGSVNCSAGNSTTEPYIAAHNILLAHASAARIYKERYQTKQHGFIGFNLFSYHFLPLRNTEEDVIAAQISFNFLVGWFMHPFLYGDYPEIMKSRAGTRIPHFTENQSELVKGSIDFIGLNYYTVMCAKHTKLLQEQRDYMADRGLAWFFYNQSKEVLPSELHSYPNLPWGLQGVLEHFKHFYGNPPIFIHENGFNLFSYHFLPLRNTEEDVIAAQISFNFLVGWFMHPFLYGDYPEIMKSRAGTRIPHFTENQSELVKGSIDFIGLNYYTVMCAKHTKLLQEQRDYMADRGLAWFFYNQSKEVLPSELHSYPNLPWGLQGVLEHFKHFYGNPPIFIHENGQVTNYNTSINDQSRVEYMKAHIGGLLDAIKNTSNVKGYFVWSFLDVFELLFGFEYTYGLYYVDFTDPNLPRSPKLSQNWYSGFLKGSNVTIDVDEGTQAVDIGIIHIDEVVDVRVRDSSGS